MARLINHLHLYSDTSVDPGADMTELSAGDRRQLVAAIDTGDLPVAPQSVRNALKAIATIERLHGEHAVQQVSGGLTGFTNTTLRTLLDGGDPPDDLGAAALAASLETQRHEALSTHLDALRLRIKEALPLILREAEDEIVTGLRDKVNAVLDDARAADHDLDGLNIDQPEHVAAASAKARAAISQLPELSRRYNRLRMVHIDYLVPARFRAGTR